MEQILVSAKVVGDMIGVSERHVRRLVAEGVLEKVKNGQYDLIDCGRRYLEHIKQKQELTDVEADKLENMLMAEKIMHERFKKKKTELIVAELEGSMHNARDIEVLWNNTIAAFKARIRGVPSKLSPLIQYMSDLAEITNLMQKEIDEVLLELSEYDANKLKKRAVDDGEDEE